MVDDGLDFGLKKARMSFIFLELMPAATRSMEPGPDPGKSPRKSRRETTFFGAVEFQFSRFDKNNESLSDSPEH